MKKLVPTAEERRRMKQSGLETEAEQHAWLTGFRGLKTPPPYKPIKRSRGSRFVTEEDTAELDKWLADNFGTVPEKRAYLMGKLNIVGGIAR